MSRMLQAIEVRKLVRDIVFTRSRELDCDGCMQLIHVYAELTLTCSTAAEKMPRVAQHLEQCFCCREEFELLLVVLRSAS